MSIRKIEKTTCRWLNLLTTLLLVTNCLVLLVLSKGGIVQWLEQWNHTPHVVGSTPSSVFKSNLT